MNEAIAHSAEQSVREQYEAYPYPWRDPANEANRLLLGAPFTLAAIDHFSFGGRRDWSRPFRVLVAGGGTGDAAIGIAQQMKDKGTPGEVVYVDLSAASRRIAEERARVRGLKNILFRTGSLLALSPTEDGQFDFINCIGVLHHLDEPAAGLRALNGVLAPDGGMNLAVYASLGRTGVYPIQQMLRHIAPPTLPASDRLAIARRLIGQLPATNLLRRTPNITDHLAGGALGDAALFDLLLHSCDRSYLITEFHDLLAAGGLRITGFPYRCLYEPEFWCTDDDTLARVQRLDDRERAAFTEGLIGFIKMHFVFVARCENQIRAAAPHATSVPVWALDFDDTTPDAPLRLSVPVQGQALTCDCTETESRIVRSIDGRKTIANIRDQMSLPDQEFSAAFTKVWNFLNGVGALFVRG